MTFSCEPDNSPRCQGAPGRERPTAAPTRSGPQLVTLRDVARRAGVSISTASTVVNGRDTALPIRDATRERILLAATELGYRPNLLARALRGSRSSLVGVIARDIGDPFHIQVLRGIDEVAKRREYRLFLGHVDYRPEVAAIYGSMFEQSHADGLIILGDLAGGDTPLDVIADHNRYVVGVTDRVARRRVPGVYADNVRGTRLALDHLWDLGHRRIVCISDARTADGRLRADEYRRYMSERGMGDLVRVHHAAQPDPEPSYRLGRELFDRIDRPTRPTAVYAASDTIAIGLLRAAFQAGVPVPEGVSIVGFDDIDAAAYTVPPLTTVTQLGTEMGRIAARLLLDMVETERSPSEVADVVVEPSLVVRQSTAPAAG
ncbi:MAG: LacI family DNA-binding transcriptional regulator [Chloroflexota bacterium]